MIEFGFVGRGLLRWGVPIVAATLIAFGVGKALVQSFAGEPIEREFTEFYVVGQTLNTHAAERIYDLDFQNRLASRVLPRATEPLNLPYGHAPFEAVLYRPLAWLSHEAAYRVWLLASLVMFCAGFALVWRSLPGLRAHGWLTPLLLLLSFYPVLGGTLFPGQVAAIPFFAVAVAICLDRRGAAVTAGAALAVCLAKPTLLVLLVPMMVVARRWRMLVGFVAGAVALAGISLASVGWGGCLAYVRMLLRYGRWAGDQQSWLNTAIYVDLNTLFRWLVGRDGWPAPALMGASAATVLPFLVRVWVTASRQQPVWHAAWATTLAWSVLLNVYTPYYDLVLVALAAMVMADFFLQSQGRLPKAYAALLAGLYVGALVCAPRERHSPIAHVQTVVLVALAVYQLRAVVATSRTTAKVVAA
jgi:hypothetical protein